MYRGPATVKMVLQFGLCICLENAADFKFHLSALSAAYLPSHMKLDIEIPSSTTLAQCERAQCYKTRQKESAAGLFLQLLLCVLLSKTFTFTNIDTYYTSVRISSYQSSEIMFHNKPKSLPQLPTAQHSFAPQDKPSTAGTQFWTSWGQTHFYNRRSCKLRTKTFRTSQYNKVRRI